MDEHAMPYGADEIRDTSARRRSCRGQSGGVATTWMGIGLRGGVVRWEGKLALTE